LSNFLQTKAQKIVPAERASVIYSLDPVYGALFSWILLGETLGGVQAYIGAAMIFTAAATNSLLEFSQEE
jgi:drug/metabolite transporter (DMT)-like permease